MAEKEGFTTKYPRRCLAFLEDGGVVWARPRYLYAFIDNVEEEMRNVRNGFASRLLPQHKGNRNGWISAEEEHEEEYEEDSDLESTATSRFNPS